MKVTVVPAQVTTVEDRIIGNLGFSQILLLIIPLFMSAGIFALLPPFMALSPYKYASMTIMLTFSGTLAIRIKGKIIASWLITILRFNLRPKFYVFNKNTLIYRQKHPVQKTPKHQNKTQTNTRRTKTPRYHVDIDQPSAAKILTTLNDPSTRIRFESDKKGGLHVRFSEVEE